MIQSLQKVIYLSVFGAACEITFHPCTLTALLRKHMCTKLSCAVFGVCMRMKGFGEAKYLMARTLSKPRLNFQGMRSEGLEDTVLRLFETNAMGFFGCKQLTRPQLQMSPSFAD